MNNEKKIAFRITPRQQEEVEKLKKKDYFNKPYSELFRDLIDRGIEYSKQVKKGE